VSVAYTRCSVCVSACVSLCRRAGALPLAPGHKWPAELDGTRRDDGTPPHTRRARRAGEANNGVRHRKASRKLTLCVSSVRAAAARFGHSARDAQPHTRQDTAAGTQANTHRHTKRRGQREQGGGGSLEMRCSFVTVPLCSPQQPLAFTPQSSSVHSPAAATRITGLTNSCVTLVTRARRCAFRPVRLPVLLLSSIRWV
jgi:hypothetical protein